VYHAIVRRRARQIFGQVSDGDFPPVLRTTARDVHHVFAGDHALGGERHGREALARWFGRLHRLFPDLKLEVTDVVATGWPWRTVVTLEWVARATLPTGDPYVNTGAHIVRMRWGRAVYIHAYEDSQRVAEACRRMAEGGIGEAAAAPITS
jgi:ketosteroid isomerase-like protein